jgi:hypothetical protein
MTELLRILLSATATICMVMLIQKISLDMDYNPIELLLYAILYLTIKNELDKHVDEDN